MGGEAVSGGWKGAGRGNKGRLAEWFAQDELFKQANPIQGLLSLRCAIFRSHSHFRLLS